jgi:serine/threonine-protein kinase
MGNEDKYLGRLLDNRYEIVEVIGTGGMSVVYKATCHRLNRSVAVKILKDEYVSNDEFRRRFHTEAQAVAMLSHPNIVAVHDVSHSENVEYIVMEMIEGITLKQYMQKRGALSWTETLHFSLQIAKALSHAHGRGIVHRDIKPQNIMILRDGTAKVADFGIAHLQSAGQETVTNDALGSVHYISPEQAKGEPVDARADIYSFGVVMYEMLTGRLPFEGDSPVAVAIQHISSIPLMPRDINPDVPKKLEAVVMKAMNPRLDERYQSIEEMRSDLEDFGKNPGAVGELSPINIADVISIKETSSSAAQKPYTGEAKRVGGAKNLKSVNDSKKSRRKSTILGISFFMLFIAAVFTFLWQFWLKDLVTEAKTLKVPDFVGTKVNDVLVNPNYTSRFNFSMSYEPNSQYPEGYVLAQDPSSGSIRNILKTGIDVKLTVSRGTNYLTVPNVLGAEYREAVIQLEKIKLVVKQDTVTSPTVPLGHVISSKPSSGEQILPGSTVYLTISGGPQIKFVKVPKITGMTLNKAIDELEALNLTIGTITLVTDNSPIGTITYQSAAPGVEVTQYTVVNLSASGGPSMVAAKTS